MLITDIDSPTGGIQAQSLRLLRELNRRGFAASVCTRNYQRRRRNEVLDGISIHRSPVAGRSIPALNSVLYLADALIWLIRNRRRYDVIHCQQMFGSAMVGLLAKRLLRKPILVRVTLSGETGEVRTVRAMPLATLRLRQLRGVDRWVALTTEMATEIRTLGVAPERIRIIQNSASIPAEAAFEPETRARLRASLELEYAPVAVFSGRLSREKGLDTLLQAFELFRERRPQAHLLLLGEGGDFRNVEAQLRGLRDEMKLNAVVHFLGHVSNVRDYLLAADLFVLPTRSEGMSNALVEAMAAGCAIVTTDIPANRDLVEHEVNALLVRPDDPEGLARAIMRIFDEPHLAQRLARAARDKAERTLSVDLMAARYLEVYDELLAASSSK